MDAEQGMARSAGSCMTMGTASTMASMAEALGMTLPGNDDPIDEDTLTRIANETGGRFFRARNTDELVGIYAELDRLEPVKAAGPAVRPWRERYPWPLAAALLLGGLALLWPERWR